MTDREFNRQYDAAQPGRARQILDELACAEYFRQLPAAKLYEALVERLEEAINIEETEMKCILDILADRLGEWEENAPFFPVIAGYKQMRSLLPEDAKRIALGIALGWSEPSRNTLSGRLAGLHPEVGCIDVWPEFCAVCDKLLEYRGDCNVHPDAKRATDS